MLWVVLEVVLGMVAWAVVHLVSRLLSRNRQSTRNRRQIENAKRSSSQPNSSSKSTPLPGRRRLTSSERSEREKKKEREKEKESGKGKEREVPQYSEDKDSVKMMAGGGGTGVRRGRHRYTREVRHSDIWAEEQERRRQQEQAAEERKQEREKAEEEREKQRVREAREMGKPLLRYGVAALQGRRRTMEDQHCALVEDLSARHPSLSFFAIYDGHAGGEVSQYLAQHLHSRVAEGIEKIIEDAGGESAWCSVLSAEQRRELREGVFAQVFRDIDEELRVAANSYMWNSGSTVVCALVEVIRSSRRNHKEEAEEEENIEKEKEKAKENENEKEKDNEEEEEEVCIHCANLGDSRCVLSLMSDRGKVIQLSEEHKPYKPSEKERIIAAGYV